MFRTHSHQTDFTFGKYFPISVTWTKGTPFSFLCWCPCGQGSWWLGHFKARIANTGHGLTCMTCQTFWMALTILQLRLHKIQSEFFQKKPSLAVFLVMTRRIVVHKYHKWIYSRNVQQSIKQAKWPTTSWSFHTVRVAQLIYCVNASLGSVVVNDYFRLLWCFVKFVIVVKCWQQHNWSVSFWDEWHQSLVSTEAKQWGSDSSWAICLEFGRYITVGTSHSAQ